MILTLIKNDIELANSHKKKYSAFSGECKSRAYSFKLQAPASNRHAYWT
jgi:hypothetical protein